MTSTLIDALSAINVGVINEQGTLEATISFEEFLMFAKVSTSTSTPMLHAKNSNSTSRYQTLTMSLTKCKSGESNSRGKSR